MVQRVNDKYRVQVRFGDQIRGGTFSRKEDALKVERELLRDREHLRAGMRAPAKMILVIDYSAEWIRRRFAEVERGELAHGTVVQDAQRLKTYALPRLGARPMASVTSGEVLELLDEAQAKHGVSSATRNRIRAVLHTLFEDAFRREKIVSNPVSRVPLVEEARVKKTAVPAADWQTYINRGYEVSHELGFALEVMFYQGIRISQVLGLQVGDFDLKANELHSRRIFEQSSRSIQPRIKGRPEGLVLPLFPRTRVAFLHHLDVTQYRRPTDFCFYGADGQVMTSYALKHRIEHLCKRFKLPRITPHLCRSAFATAAEEAGFSKEDIQRMLGHSTVIVTERYIRRTAGPLLEKGERLGFGSAPAAGDNVIKLEGSR